MTSIREQCEDAQVPFFFKQWGGVRKSEAGRLLDGRTYDAVPERESRKVPPHRVRMGLIEEVRKWEPEHGPAGDSVKDAQDRQVLLFQGVAACDGL